MKKSMKETVESLKNSTSQKDDFMRQLAKMDTGEIPEESLAKINGGKGIAGPLIPIVFGLLIPTPPIIVEF